jgi:sulfatase maturation enzyme AslB (radical SAM superfamily)
MSNRTLKNTAFCVLPFIEKFQDLDGKNYLCCHSRIPVVDSEMDHIRSQILDQQLISQCEGCYRLEQQKTISPRQIETSRWLQDPEVKSYVENWQPGTASHICFYDIRFDNKCNLACIGCGPKSSSLWAKELGVTAAKHSLNFDINQALTAKKVYLAGGEPLIIDQFIDFITQVSQQDQQPELVINTNLTRINDELKHTLQHIKNLTLVVSIDAHGSVNEYHRWPLKWKKLVDNLEWVQSINCNIFFNTVADAVTVLNLQQIQELEHFANSWNIEILTRPAALMINNLPEKLKSSVLENFKKIKQSKFYKQDPVFRSRVAAIELAISQPGDDQLLATFIKDLDQRRNINHETYLGVQLT